MMEIVSVREARHPTRRLSADVQRFLQALRREITDDDSGWDAARLIEEAERFIQPEAGDLNRLEEFYLENAHAGVGHRANDIWGTSPFFIAETTRSHEVLSAAGVFTHLRGRYYEMGAARTSARGGGFEPHSLHEILICVRCLHAIVMEYDLCVVFAAARPIDRRTKHNLCKCGFEEWPELPGDLADITGRIRDLFDGDSPEPDFLRLPSEKHPELAERFLRWADEGIELHRTNRETQARESLQVRFDEMILLSKFREAIETVAGA